MTTPARRYVDGRQVGAPPPAAGLGWKQPHSRHHDPDEGGDLPAPSASPREAEPSRPPEARVGFGVIQRDVPLPVLQRKGTKLHDLAAKMQPGDSVLLETKHQAHGLCRTGKAMGLSMTSRRVDGGYRVWRMEGGE